MKNIFFCPAGGCRKALFFAPPGRGFIAGPAARPFSAARLLQVETRFARLTPLHFMSRESFAFPPHTFRSVSP
ncbi:MAG: hypothetical protein FWD46_07515, partial [Cystobacterineae bacterium]|nr:hypothetical protein [Cystobacterineae bacterium]